MNILDNELVRKYFLESDSTCTCGKNEWRDNHLPKMAMKILQAMQDPIKEGERYLNSANREDWILLEDCPQLVEGWHPFALRLPDRFQKQECQFCETYKIHICDPKPTPEPETCFSGCNHPEHQGTTNQKDDVEEKIQSILNCPAKDKDLRWFGIENMLRELVALARRSV